MKTSAFLIITLIAACGRDSHPATSPAGVQRPPVTSTADVPDLELDMQQVDGLPTTALVDPGAAHKQPVEEAVAILHSTSGHDVSGIVRFVDVEGPGLEVFAVAHGLSDRPHAYHVHVYGDCSAPDATSAGPHFHFTGSSFDKEVGIITGNLGQLQRHETGPTSSHKTRLETASLQGEFSIIGRAVVIHERGNDPDVTPDGAAGARLACGVIGVANPRPPKAASR